MVAGQVCDHSFAVRVRAQGKNTKKFREVLTKAATERGDKYNVLWVDPATNPQVQRGFTQTSRPGGLVVTCSQAQTIICTIQLAQQSR